MSSFPAPFLKVSLLIAAVSLAAPLIASAVLFEAPLPTVKSIGLSFAVKVGGQTMKAPVTVAANTDFTLTWTTTSDTAVGCVSNWSTETLPATGSTVGSITASRPFTITCFGRGAAQTASAKVNVGVADLSVSSFSASGLKSSRTRGSYISGQYLLKVNIKNGGKLTVGTAFRIKYMESADGTSNWTSAAEETISGIGGSKSIKLADLSRQGSAGAETRYYQVCVDTENKVAEQKEDNNCSKVLGPYTFVAP